MGTNPIEVTLIKITNQDLRDILITVNTQIGGGSRAWSPCCRVVTLRQPQFLCSAAFISFILFIALIFTPTSVTSLSPLSEQILYYPHSSFSPSTPDQVLTLSCYHK